MPEQVKTDEPEYSRIIAACERYPWAILEEKLHEIAAVLEIRARGGHVATDRIKAAINARGAQPSIFSKQGSIAVIPLSGSIFQKANIVTQSSGGTSTEVFGSTMAELVADNSISAIVIDVNSPGGNTAGVPELAAKIMEMRSQKKIVAVANSLMASAAYWIASAASEIVAAPSALVGSIGVLSMHADYSKQLEQDGVKVTLITAGKFKGEGSPYEPLSDDARSGMQALVDDYYQLFVSAVAQQRGVTANEVRTGFGEGRVVLAQQAVKLGMVDRVATLEQTLQQLSVETGAKQIVGASRHSVKLLEREVEALS